MTVVTLAQDLSFQTNEQYPHSKISIKDKQDFMKGQISFQKENCSIDFLSIIQGQQGLGIGTQLLYKAMEELKNCHQVTGYGLGSMLQFYHSMGANITWTYRKPDPSHPHQWQLFGHFSLHPHKFFEIVRPLSKF
jgi:hypothetical protein